MKQRIEKTLKDNLSPKLLEVENNSYLHAGHSGDNGTGETHFKVMVESDQFNNLSKVAAHRLINQLLKDEFEKGLHALEIKIMN
jgi:BolA family transcriptional regulator, general stress-responsive regulator